ncbi:unnamed protein product [Cercospora beticola]|nr:unnamed protein product [Cercospora beticola]
MWPYYGYVLLGRRDEVESAHGLPRFPWSEAEVICRRSTQHMALGAVTSRLPAPKDQRRPVQRQQQHGASAHDESTSPPKHGVGVNVAHRMTLGQSSLRGSRAVARRTSLFQPSPLERRRMAVHTRPHFLRR